MIKIRFANKYDMKNIFDLSNDITVRENSIHKEQIKWEEHVEWFKNKLSDDNCIFYVCCEDDDFLGYCHIDKEDNSAEWVVTIHILPKYRSKGYGCKILNFVTEKNREKNIVAYVKENNSASSNLFFKCGFKNSICRNFNYVRFNKFIFRAKKNIISISNSLYEGTSLLTKSNIEYIFNKSDLTFEKLQQINPKYVFFPHWSYIIPSEIYENFNCIIFHMTDLPFGRGGSPLQNLISRGIKKTKISAIKCIKELDAGDIFIKKDLDISNGSAAEIYNNAGEIISNMIDEIIETNPKPIPQSGKVVEFKRRTPEQSNIIDLDNIQIIYDYIRMLDAKGYPRAFIYSKNTKYEFFNAKLENGKLTAKVEISVKNNE